MTTKLTEEDLVKFSRLLNEGLLYKQIARKLFISKGAVQKRVAILCKELGVNTKKQALQRAKRLGWLN